MTTTDWAAGAASGTRDGRKDEEKVAVAARGACATNFTHGLRARYIHPEASPYHRNWLAGLPANGLRRDTQVTTAVNRDRV